MPRRQGVLHSSTTSARPSATSWVVPTPWCSAGGGRVVRTAAGAARGDRRVFPRGRAGVRHAGGERGPSRGGSGVRRRSRCSRPGTADLEAVRGGTPVSGADPGDRHPGTTRHRLRPMTALPLPSFVERRTPTRSGRRYFVRTFGCQMNEHDSERIRGLLESDGMVPANGAEDADVVLLNTCCIRENADNRLYGNLGQLKAIKDERPGMRILVAGCLAQKDRDIVREKAPWVDVVFGTHNLHRVLTLLDHAEEWGPVTEIWEETASIDDVPSTLPTHREVPHSAWVTITIGCNNACTFCIVPTVRGKEISRRPADILREVRELVAEGVSEVTLLGQNVNS